MTFVWAGESLFCTRQFFYVLWHVVKLLGFSGGSVVKNPPAVQEMCVRNLGWGNPPEKAVTTHFSVLAWEIPWPEGPGGLQPMGLQRVGHTEHTHAPYLSKLHVKGGAHIHLVFLMRLTFWNV